MNSSDLRLVRLIPITGEGSFSRVSEATYWDSLGVLQTAPPNTLRVTYDPADLSKAPYALVEKSKTNFIRNNTLQGAVTGVVGSGGSLPTHWGVALGTGLSMDVVEIGMSQGMRYMDLRIYGTPTTGSSGIRPESLTSGVSAAANQILAYSLFMSLVSGRIDSSTAVRLSTVFYDSNSASFASENAPRLDGLISAKLARYSHVSAAAPEAAVSARSQILIGHAVGVAIDFTIRICAPQSEDDEVTSVINTSGTAVTRAADVVGPGAGLVYSNVPITEPLWVAGTYALGAKVRDAQNFVFESLAAGNTSVLTDKTKWLPLGVTNRWKAFDKAVNSQTTAPGALTFSVKPGTVATTLMLLNMEGASVTVSQSDSGYVKTQSLVSHDVDNWYDFYYEEPVRAGDAVFTDIPPYPNSMLTVSIDNGPLDSKIGACLVGKPFTLGKVTASFKAGVLSYSTSTTDTFGNITMVKRYNAPRMNFEVSIPAGFEDRAYRNLRDYTDVELGILVGDRFSMGIGYGFLGQWDVPKSGGGRTASIEFKGLV